jgi:hypothetical protein
MVNFEVRVGPVDVLGAVSGRGRSMVGRAALRQLAGSAARTLPAAGEAEEAEEAGERLGNAFERRRGHREHVLGRDRERVVAEVVVVAVAVVEEEALDRHEARMGLEKRGRRAC